MGWDGGKKPFVPTMGRHLTASVLVKWRFKVGTKFCSNQEPPFNRQHAG